LRFCTYTLVDELETINDQHEQDPANIDLAQDTFLLLFRVWLELFMENFKNLITILNLLGVLGFRLGRGNSFEFYGRCAMLVSVVGCHCCRGVPIK